MLKISNLLNIFKLNSNENEQFSVIDFKSVQDKANKLADRIEDDIEQLTEILLEYESHEVAQDEIERTLDLLRNLKENEEYFKLRIGAVTSFLPRNQPLYALSCFVIVPSLMASEVHFRIPHSQRFFLQRVIDLLGIEKMFPNIQISKKQRLDFLTERTALLFDPQTKQTIPVTDVVIFTGSSTHADHLRVIFDKKTLFITNGSGHNPMVIAQDANIEDAVTGALKLLLYNQGQDCAAPNSILVHKDIFEDFLVKLRSDLRKENVGEYKNRENRVGPISDPKDLVRIQSFLIENREWLDKSTPGVIYASQSLVEPTIICKPLKEGGNFTELFSPILMVQEYVNDEQLKDYFEDPRYAENAMYITIYGTSPYINSLANKKFDGKILHDSWTILHNSNPHINGFERGTQPYGGYGYAASSLSFEGKIVSKPTLPQRDIFEYLVKPLLEIENLKEYIAKRKKFTEIQTKNVYKLLRMQSSKESHKSEEVNSKDIYLDLNFVKENIGTVRYLKLELDSVYKLLENPNVQHISSLNKEEIDMIKKLKTALENKHNYEAEEFRSLLYAIPKVEGLELVENKKRQMSFFKCIYQMLFAANTGPQLASFLREVENDKIIHLLDV